MRRDDLGRQRRARRILGAQRRVELLERVDRLERRDAGPGRLVERVPGGGHAGEQGVAADRRHLHRVEQGAGVGPLLVDLVDVPVFHT